MVGPYVQVLHIWWVHMYRCSIYGGSICTGVPYMVGPYVQVLHIWWVHMYRCSIYGGFICTGAPYMVGSYVQVLHIWWVHMYRCSIYGGFICTGAPYVQLLYLPLTEGRNVACIVRMYIVYVAESQNEHVVDQSVCIDGYTHNTTLDSGDTVQLGTTVILVCTVTGIPYGVQTTYRWTCPHGTCDIGSHILKIPLISTSDEGNYIPVLYWLMVSIRVLYLHSLLYHQVSCHNTTYSNTYKTSPIPPYYRFRFDSY